MNIRKSPKELLLLGAGLAIVIAVALLEPISQDPLYHQFSDQRPLGNLPNFMNVLSNLPFLIVGGLGLHFVIANKDTLASKMKLAWLIFFIGILLTAFGSGYYHLQPGNGPLVWDRLPMTIGFMSLVAIIIAEYHSPPLGKKLLLPLLLIGFASVMYWSHTETLGRGDLRPYVIVQFLPIVLIPLVISLYRSRSILGRYLWWMIGFYVASKIAEFYDAKLYEIGGIISGHSIKHLIAALAPASLLYGLTQRSVDQ